MEEIYRILGDVDLWKLPTYSDEESLEVTEFWLHHATKKVEVSTRTISHETREAWLDKRQDGEDEAQRSLIARFVWVVADQMNDRISLSVSAQKVLIKRFGLKLAYDYFKTFFSGIHSLPPTSTPQLDQQAHAFCYGPKIAAIWSKSIFKDTPTGQSIIEGLIFLPATPKEPSHSDKEKPQKESKDPLKDLQGFLQAAPWNHELCRSAAFPAYLFSHLLTREITKTAAAIGLSIRSVESRTGYHAFSRVEAGDPNELGVLSAKTSGHLGKLATARRKVKVICQLLEFIKETVEEESKHSEHDFQEHGTVGLMHANVAVLERRLDMQRVELEHIGERVKIQTEALIHLIQQNDSISNYELSRWTQDISLTSQRDAASMKTLAIVTMFFLPGSFISALFSTNMFDWDGVDLTDKKSIGVSLTPQFGLYWAVTVPLTLITFILYFIWLWHQGQSRSKIEREKAKKLSRFREEQKNKRSRIIERDQIAQRRETLVMDQEKDILENNLQDGSTDPHAVSSADKLGFGRLRRIARDSAV